MAKKKVLSLEEKLEEALIPKEDQPYELPENWNWIRLGEVGKWGSGGTPSRSKSEFYTNGTIPWIKTGELNGSYIFDAKEYITEEALKKSSAKIFPKGSIAIAMYGATIGKIGIFGNNLSTNQACAVVKTIKNIENKFLFYYLKAEKNNFIELGKGGAQPNISQTVIKNYYFPLPPKFEQERIVNKIESMFEKINKAKELIYEARETFELRRASILHQAFTGELTKEWREKNPIESGKLSVDNLLEKINVEKMNKWEDECAKVVEVGKRKPKKPVIKPVEQIHHLCH